VYFQARYSFCYQADGVKAFDEMQKSGHTRIFITILRIKKHPTNRLSWIHIHSCCMAIIEVKLCQLVPQHTLCVVIMQFNLYQAQLVPSVIN